jgi:hypothetical protein
MLLIFALTLAAAAPLSAKDRLGVYQGWAAFRDPETPPLLCDFRTRRDDRTTNAGGLCLHRFLAKAQGDAPALRAALARSVGQQRRDIDRGRPALSFKGQ